MRVLICGSRDFTDRTAIDTVVLGYTVQVGWRHVTVIEGGAKGADTIAKSVADVHCVDVEEYPADWDKHGKAAGPIRNKQMLVEGKPDVVWAFVNKPLHESRGTYNMVDQAVAAGVPTYVVQAMQ